MLERTQVRMDVFKEHEMDTQPQPQGSGCTPTVFMIVGGAIMLFALAGSLALYFWGHQPYQGGEQWNDVIASIFIVFAGLPVFIMGLVLVLVGVFQKVRGKRKAAQGDHR
jgi:hypothetical protein